MQAVILAAGRGTRLGVITNTIPKALIPIHGRPVLCYTLDALPAAISDVIIVIGHLGKQIQDTIGAVHNNRKISDVRQDQLSGTADALWRAQSFLNQEPFLVINGDDIYDTQSLGRLSDCGAYALGLISGLPPGAGYRAFRLDDRGAVIAADVVTEAGLQDDALIATGAYVLNYDIFNQPLVQLRNGEYGLPQTLLAMMSRIELRGVIMDAWCQINYPEDIARAEKHIIDHGLIEK